MSQAIKIIIDKKLQQRLILEIEKVLASNNFMLGPQVQSFEKNFAHFCGTKEAIGVANGTDALRLALRAIGISRGDKVLTVSFTSPFTALAIISEGAIPVFCDVDEKTMTIDLESAKEHIDKQVKAIVPVHIFGNPCNIQGLMKFSEKFKIPIIEDACQAHGASYMGKMVGSFGKAAAFSFYPTKNLGGLGDGGAITTNDSKLASLIKEMRNGGQQKRFWHTLAGINSRLDEIQAAVLSIRLKMLKDENKKRQYLATNYMRRLAGLPIKFQASFPSAVSVYHLFTIRVKNRDKLMSHLAKNNLPCDVYYPYPVHIQPAFKSYSNSKLPITEKLSKEVLSLPVYPGFSDSDQNKLINAIVNFYK